MLVKNTRNSLLNAFHITLSGTTLNVRPKFFLLPKCLFIITVEQNIRLYFLRFQFKFCENYHMKVGETCFKYSYAGSNYVDLKVSNQCMSVFQNFCNMLVELSDLLDHLQNKGTPLHCHWWMYLNWKYNESNCFNFC